MPNVSNVPRKCNHCKKPLPPDTGPLQFSCSPECQEKLDKSNGLAGIIIWGFILLCVTNTANNARVESNITWGFIAAGLWLLTFWLTKWKLPVKIVGTVAVVSLLVYALVFCLSPAGIQASSEKRRSQQQAASHEAQVQAAQMKQQQADDAAQEAKQKADDAAKQKQAALAQQDSTETKNEVFFDAQQVITERLKSPSSAKFPDYEDGFVTRTGDNTYHVISYVDSQNSFGAMLRAKWTATIHRESDDKFRSEGVVIQQP